MAVLTSRNLEILRLSLRIPDSPKYAWSAIWMRKLRSFLDIGDAGRKLNQPCACSTPVFMSVNAVTATSA